MEYVSKFDGVGMLCLLCILSIESSRFVGLYVSICNIGVSH